MGDRGRVGRPGGPSVAGAGEGDEAGPPGRRADEFAGGLHGVAARRSAEPDPCPVGESWRQGVEQLGDEGVLDGCGQVEDVEGCAGVEDLADGFQDDGMVVPERERAGTREAVQVAAAVRALDGQPSRPHRDDRQGPGIGPGRGLASGLAAQNPLLCHARSWCRVAVDRTTGEGFHRRTPHSGLL